jgi:hypothetical protein
MSRPFNGPSTTGNPSGGGRGNNPSWDDGDEGSGVGGWPSSTIAYQGPSPEELRRRALEGATKEIVATSVFRIKYSTRAKLIAAFQAECAMFGGYGKPAPKDMSAGQRRNACKSAKRELDQLSRSLLDDYAKVLRQARESLAAHGFAVIERRVHAALSSFQLTMLDKKLAAAESTISKEIRGHVTLDELIRYLEL